MAKSRMGSRVVTGLDDVIRALRFKKEQHAEGLHVGLSLAGEALLGWSQDLVPVDKGVLHDSGYVLVEGEGYDTIVDVGYTAHYAIYVHENLNVHHPNGQAKYLEQPANERRAEIRKMVRDEVVSRR